MKNIRFPHLVLLFLLISAIPGQPQETAVNPGTKIQNDVSRIKAQIEKISSRTFTRSIKTGVKSKEEIKQYLLATFKEEFDPLVYYYNTLYREFGLISEDMDIREILLSLLTSQIGGFYDPKKKEFYLSKSYTAFSEMIIAHELVHALQDCYLPLDTLLLLSDLGYGKTSPVKNDDIGLARLSFIEGEAQYVSTLYMTTSGAFADAAALKELLSPEMIVSQLQLSMSPPVISNQLMFPYTKGLAWVTGRYEKAGWAGLRKAEKRLPCSSEQILHPAKYETNETPVFISLPIPQKNNPWKLEIQNSLGEFMCDEIVRTLSGDFVKGMRAAAGWGGDSIYLLKNKNEHLFIWYTVWDNQKEADEFHGYFTDGLKRRYKNADAEKNKNALTTPAGRTITVSRNETHIIYISAPDADTHALASTWAKAPELRTWEQHIQKLTKNKGEKNEKD